MHRTAAAIIEALDAETKDRYAHAQCAAEAAASLATVEALDELRLTDRAGFWAVLALRDEAQLVDLAIDYAAWFSARYGAELSWRATLDRWQQRLGR